VEEELRDLAASLEALTESPLTREQAREQIREELGHTLSIPPDSITITWQDGRMRVDLPMRLHYLDHLERISAILDDVAARLSGEGANPLEDNDEEWAERIARLRGED
jgi:hypothetical protein